MADLEKLNNIINSLENEADKLVEFNKVYAEIASLKESITESADLLKSLNANQEEIGEHVKSELESLNNALKEIDKKLSDKIEEIYKDNKTFQKELDSSISTRLEKTKSDIQVDLRNEISRTQTTLESSLSNKFSSLETDLRKSSTEQDKQINMIKILLFVTIALVAVAIVGVFIK